MRRVGLQVIALIGLLLLATGGSAFADKRIALVVGNSAYQNVPKLPNPANDATAVAQLFKGSGFDVVSLNLDVGNLDFKRALRRFEDAAADSDIAVVYFAGHGIEIGGTNYMIPVDAKLATDLDAQDEAISLDRIVDSVSAARRLRVVILDACRDNPFAVNMRRQRQASTRAVTRGLARVEVASTDTLIAYAARAGSTAEDGASDHSPFTTALLNNLTTPGLDVRIAFGRIRDEVLRLTSQRQEPFVYGSLGGGEISLVPPPAQPQAPAAAAAGASTDPNASARRDYEFFERVGTLEAWDAFLQLYSTGPYADLARTQRARLLSGESRSTVALATPTPPPSPPAPSPAGAAPGEVARMIQTELKRVGCFAGDIDGSWSPASRRALDLFNKNAGTSLDTKTPTFDTFDAVTAKTVRVCPLDCGRGFHADGDQCVRTVCDAGSAPDAKGVCAPIDSRTRAASKPADDTPKPPPSNANANTNSKPSASANTKSSDASKSAGATQSVACGRFGCQAVKKGCTVRTEMFREETVQIPVCN